MVKSIRLMNMEEYIIEKGVVSMDELCKKYEISMNTLRNDINELADKGRVKKVYGGVCSNSTSSSALVSYDIRKNQNVEIKSQIAKAASAFVHDGDIIYVDSGTTAVKMIEHLEGITHLTIVTHSLDVINAARNMDNVEVFCLGGRLQQSTNCFIGMGSAGLLDNYNIGKAFLGTKGITYDGAVTDSSMGEFDIKKWAVSRAKEVFLLADSGKFGKAGLISYTTLDKVNTLITDKAASDNLLSICEKKNTTVIFA